jgi:glycosyltransferase involved in cell wall biosynthesis
LLHESGNYRVRVSCLDGQGVLRGEVERLGLGEIQSYPLTSFYDRNAVVQLKRFARYLKDSKTDVIHTHDFYTNIFGMTAAALAHVPVRIASRRQSAVRAAVKRLLERRAYGLAHAVIANCEEVRDQLVREGVPVEKIVTVHNGLEMERVAARPDFVRDEALAKFGLPREDGRRFVTIVANLRTVKDHQTFLRAARRVSEAAPQAAFVIAGEGALLAELHALAARFGLERDTFFTGRCGRLAELLFVSDVCVLSSTSEGFSNSILEYMAAARPVVATDVGGAREAIVEGETGYLVKAGDDEKMALRIVDLLDNPQQARAMGERGQRIVREKFSCEAQLERTEKLYQRLLGTAPSTRSSVERMGREKVSEADQASR